MTRLLRLRRPLEAVILIPTLLMLSVLPILRPSTQTAQRADAVVVLSGDHGERLPIARGVVDRGLTGTLVFVGTPDRAQEDALCGARGGIEYICLRPQPDNTRAEAQALSHLAKSRRWRNVVVVTSRYHVTRFRLLFRRCFNGEVRMMAGEPTYGRAEHNRQARLEWAKLLYTLVGLGGC